MRLDALAKSLDIQVPVAASRAGGQGQGRQRNIYAVTDNKPETGSNADLLQRIAHLEEQLKQAAGSSKGAEGSSSSKANSKSEIRVVSLLVKMGLQRLRETMQHAQILKRTHVRSVRS